MFVTIWMCTHEWSLISTGTAFVRDVPPPLQLLVRVDPFEEPAERPVAAHGDVDPHALDRPTRQPASRAPPPRETAGCSMISSVSGSVERHGLDLSRPPRPSRRTAPCKTAASHQLGVRPLLDHAPVLEHDDQVGVADRREPVRDDERRPAGEQAPQGLLDPPLGADVHRRGGLVEDEDARGGEERAGERDELPLAEREPLPRSPSSVS